MKKISRVRKIAFWPLNYLNVNIKFMFIKRISKKKKKNHFHSYRLVRLEKRNIYMSEGQQTFTIVWQLAWGFHYFLKKSKFSIRLWLFIHFDDWLQVGLCMLYLVIYGMVLKWHLVIILSKYTNSLYNLLSYLEFFLRVLSVWGNVEWLSIFFFMHFLTCLIRVRTFTFWKLLNTD